MASIEKLLCRAPTGAKPWTSLSCCLPQSGYPPQSSYLNSASTCPERRNKREAAYVKTGEEKLGEFSAEGRSGFSASLVPFPNDCLPLATTTAQWLGARVGRTIDLQRKNCQQPDFSETEISMPHLVDMFGVDMFGVDFVGLSRAKPHEAKLAVNKNRVKDCGRKLPRFDSFGNIRNRITS